MRNARLWIAVLAMGPVLAAEGRDFRLSFTAVLPEDSGLTAGFGRGREVLSVRSQENGYSWSYRNVDGTDERTCLYPGTSASTEKVNAWWEKSLYSPNGRYRRTFDLPANVFLWSEYLFSQNYVGASERVLSFEVVRIGGRLMFSVDGILLECVAATEDLDWTRFQVKGTGAAKVSEVVEEGVNAPHGFYCVPFGKVATQAGNPVSTACRVEGVPFLGAAKSVDLSHSWVREACMPEYGEPNNGAFGGRWSGALSGNPCRLQFRVPTARYDEMYLLASCRGNPSLAIQFYRPSSGFPVSFAPVEAVATDGNVQLVRIPIDQGRLMGVSDRSVVEFELIARENIYRSMPEPCHTSVHGGGVRSDVKVHAITLHETDRPIDFTPESFGNVWVGLRPFPAYRVEIGNRSATNRQHVVRLLSTSYDGSSKTEQVHDVSVVAGQTAVARLEVPVDLVGWHSLRLEVDGESYERSLVVLRSREYKKRAFDAAGHFFGCWPPDVYHWNLPAYDSCRLSFPLGIDTFAFGDRFSDGRIFELAKKYGVSDYEVLKTSKAPRSPHDPDLARKLDAARKVPDEVHTPSCQHLYAEPGGIGETYVLPELYGEKRTPRSAEEEQRYSHYKEGILKFVPLFREKYPGTKLLMPWGSPAFGIAFLEDPETCELSDGMAIDNGQFDRLPEALLGQCSLYGVTVYNRTWRKYRSGKPVLTTIEGPCLCRVGPGALTPRESMDHYMRCMLMLSANGVNRLFASVGGHPESLSYWGEQHYNSGGFTGVTLNPYPSYAGQGTLIRHLRNAEFVRAVPTGSLGIFNLEYRDVKKGTSLNVVWCIRGKVPFEVQGATVYDAMDNVPRVRLATSSPAFVVGAKGPIVFGKQEFEPADVAPARDAVCIADLSKWKQVCESGEDGYVNSFPVDIRRYPCEMAVSNCAGRLSVALRAGAPDRGIMPLFTTLVPSRPIELPGRPGTLALETTAVSDWGRVVYVLRDAEGETFISVGGKGVYNSDDTPYASYFTFDGTRLIRMELPGARPWDGFLTAGSVWWGSSGGNGRVDYPLSLVKMHVERRMKTMYVNELVAAPPGPILFGKLYAEDIDMDDSPTMPLPPVSFKPVNPLAEVNGVLPPTRITAIRKPDHYYDGTRGHFDFEEMKDAAGYDIYVSLAEDGAGAILLGRNLKNSGALVSGFKANRDFYAFIVWRDKSGRESRPSKPFKFRTVDEFANK